MTMMPLPKTICPLARKTLAPTSPRKDTEVPATITSMLLHPKTPTKNRNPMITLPVIRNPHLTNKTQT